MAWRTSDTNKSYEIDRIREDLQEKKSGSTENPLNWWAKMFSEASEDVTVTQTRDNEKH